MLIDRFLDARMLPIVTPQDYKSHLMQTMHTAFQLVKANLKETRIKMKKQYDKRAKQLNFKIGD